MPEKGGRGGTACIRDLSTPEIKLKPTTRGRLGSKRKMADAGPSSHSLHPRNNRSTITCVWFPREPFKLVVNKSKEYKDSFIFYIGSGLS